MQLVDFQYNGDRLSEYGLMVCSFDGNDDNIDVGNTLALNKVKAPNSNRHMIVNASYENTFPPSFQVCKNSCMDGNYALSEKEIRAIMRWLNRRRFCKLKPIYDEPVFTDVYYNATFNVQLIKIGGDVVGLDLTVETDSPFGYHEPITYRHTFESVYESWVLQDYSDEVGYVYCDATIKCLEDGDLEIYNACDRRNKVSIKNCSKGETITLRGQLKLIETDRWHDALYNDFNYNFLRICNSYDHAENEFSVSAPCELTLTYSPVRKVGMIV